MPEGILSRVQLCDDCDCIQKINGVNTIDRSLFASKTDFQTGIIPACIFMYHLRLHHSCNLCKYCGNGYAREPSNSAPSLMSDFHMIPFPLLFLRAPLLSLRAPL